MKMVSQVTVWFPPIEPYDSGMLDVGDGHRVYWECCGNPDGQPAVYLHGGPGSGSTPSARRYFDPAVYRVVLFDQRGSGRSRPLASEAEADLSANTTAHLIADIEQLRQYHEADSWTVLGISWGTCLGLAYAQAHPQRVRALVLASAGTNSRREVDWLTRDVGRIFPREWDRFAAAVPAALRDLPLVDAYATMLFDPDPAVREHAARQWCAWEDAHISLLPATRPARATKTRNSGSGSPAWSRTTGGTLPFSRTASCCGTLRCWMASPACSSTAVMTSAARWTSPGGCPGAGLPASCTSSTTRATAATTASPPS
jgi:proline iminopeptidase